MKPRIIVSLMLCGMVYSFPVSCVLLSCASSPGARVSEGKNIADYFNILSDQKVVRGRISSEKGAYTVKMSDCDVLRSAKIDPGKNSIYCNFYNPCCGPPPEYDAVVKLSESSDRTVFTHVWIRERTFGDVTSDYYRFTAKGFIKIPKKELPAELLAKFR